MTEIQELKTELKQDIKDQFTELKDDIHRLDARVAELDRYVRNGFSTRLTTVETIVKEKITPDVARNSTIIMSIFSVLSVLAIAIYTVFAK